MTPKTEAIYNTNKYVIGYPQKVHSNHMWSISCPMSGHNLPNSCKLPLESMLLILANISIYSHKHSVESTATNKTWEAVGWPPMIGFIPVHLMVLNQESYIYFWSSINSIYTYIVLYWYKLKTIQKPQSSTYTTEGEGVQKRDQTRS